MNRWIAVGSLVLLAMLVNCADLSAGDGFWGRSSNRVHRSSTPAHWQGQRTRTYRARGNSGTRNLNNGRSRLPAGRSYYQGRYFGNFNNRFYGPQYGYF